MSVVGQRYGAGTVEALDRFAELLRKTDAPLDEPCLLIAAHLYPGIELVGELARLDDVTAQVAAPTLDELRTGLFVRLGFRGDVDTYRDPANSLLPRVLDRRLGIPITLSVLMIEVGRRLGIPLIGVGLPGHFLVGDASRRGVFIDPFDAGRVLDRTDCTHLLQRIHGPDAVLQDAHLEPSSATAIIARVLQNLRVSYLGNKDRGRLVEVLRMRSAIPGTPATERRDLAGALARTGRFDLAATELDLAAAATPGSVGDQLREQAHQLRARLN